MNKWSVFIWGTGRVSEWIISQCDILDQYNIIGFIDNDIYKVGKNYKNYMVYSPEILIEKNADKIVILSDFYDDIKNQIVETFPHMKEKIENKYFFFKDMILRRYKNSKEDEIINIIKYLKKNDLDIFNYDFKNRYKKLEIDIEYDERNKMFFAWHFGKRMYFSKQYNTMERAKEYYRSLLIEQDLHSPHRYLTTDFNVDVGDIVVDIGVAEGNFSLEIVEKVSRLYLIETDEQWIEALRETFKNYQDKIVIIKKYITSIDIGKYATLNSLIDEPVNFIKMDIEGNEWDALIGADKIFEKSEYLKCAICVYHHDFDETLVRNVLTKYGMTCSNTMGYMWYPFGERKTHMPTKLCRGIIQGKK